MCSFLASYGPSPSRHGLPPEVILTEAIEAYAGEEPGRHYQVTNDYHPERQQYHSEYRRLEQSETGLSNNIIY